MNWLHQLESRAKQKLSKEIYDFIAGGANDESTVEENINAFSRSKLVPRVLQNVKSIDTQLTLLGTELDSPIAIAPTAPHRLIHEEAELATRKAAEETNSLMIVSCMASLSLETIANGASNPLWFQIQIFRNRDFTLNLIRRAEDAGYKAIVVTVDMPIVGNRQRDLMNRFKIPIAAQPANLYEAGLIDSNQSNLNFKLHTNELLDPSVNWSDIEWLKRQTDLPILLKGILHPIDAQEASDRNIDGIIVSNHGGRQSGQVISTLEALSVIQKKLNSKIPLLVDGGIRSGIDVLKALALGAKAILIGRPLLWGIAVGGIAGGAGVLRQFQRELIQGMALCGLPNLDSIYKSQVLSKLNINDV